MSIERRYEGGERIFTPTCDVCGDMLDDEYDFYDAVKAEREAGWRSRRYHGKWWDMCPACQEKENRESAAGDFAQIAGRA